MNTSSMLPLHVHVSSHDDTEYRPAHLSPMCGWEKVETSSPQKTVITPTKRKVTNDISVPSSTQRELLPMCFTNDDPSPTKSDSGHGTDLIEKSADESLYFKVPDIALKDLYDWAKPLSTCRVTTVNPARGLITQKSSAGSTVEVNEELIALFRYGNGVFAVSEKCPHAGGPLHLGDIEVLPNSSSVCVTCPWHGWKMDLSNGKVLFPLNRSDRARVYKTMLDDDGCVWIGFDTFSANYFNLSSTQDF